LETQKVLIQRRVFIQRKIFHRDFAARTDRVEIKISGPGNFLAGIRRAGERVRIFVVGIGAEIFQRDVHRPDHALEWSAGRQVGERNGGASDVQPVNAERERLGGRLRGRGVRREFRDEIGKVQRVILVHLHADKGVRGGDFLEHPWMSEERRELKIHIDFIPRDERLAIFVLDEQPANRGGEREGIDFYFLDGDSAIELLRKLFDGERADDQRRVAGCAEGCEESVRQGHGCAEEEEIRGCAE